MRKQAELRKTGLPVTKQTLPRGSRDWWVNVRWLFFMLYPRQPDFGSWGGDLSLTQFSRVTWGRPELLAWSFVAWALSLLSFASSSLEHYWAIVWALNLKQMGLVYILVFLFHCIGTCDLFPYWNNSMTRTRPL